MIALEITFPAGRFHATPWDRAVNEGEVEWPPSPWRLMRALVAGYANAGGRDPELFTTLLDQLAEAPRFVLPPAIASHTRHYMPGEATAKTLVLDAFVAIERSAHAYVIWDNALLGEQERRTLDLACSGISYLGRAESWCDVRPVDDAPVENDCIPVGLASRSTQTGPSARRLGVAPDVRGRGLLEALCVPTGAVRGLRKLQPPGSAWLEYRFPPGFGLAPSEDVRADRARSALLPPWSSLRFVLEGRNAEVRPSVSETLTVAEAFRAAAMTAYSALGNGEVAPPELSGKIGEKPLSGHEHAFFLPRDLDRDGRIDHVDVWFRAGTSHQTYRAVRSAQRLWNWRLGKDETFALTYLGEATRETARVWRSTSAFLLAVHPRYVGSEARRARYAPEAQLVTSLIEHGFPEPSSIRPWPSPATIKHERGGTTLLSGFRSSRKDDRVIDKPRGFTIEFAEEVSGPLAVGRYAHFGMGQFEPAG